MKKITVSAPGKLMLFGEHAAVDGYPCIVTAVNQRITLTAEITNTNELQIAAPDVKIVAYKKLLSKLGEGDIPKGAKFVEIAVKNILCHAEHPKGASYKVAALVSASPNDQHITRGSRIKSGMTDSFGLKITTSSEFSSQFGFGSSSASTVCVVKALSELFDLQLDNKTVFDIAYQTVLDIQGKGSGFDVAAAIYGGTLYFVAGGKVIEPLMLRDLPLVVGYSGIKADTVTLMNKVKTTFAAKKDKLVDIYCSIENIVNNAKQALLTSSFIEVGKLMNSNQLLLSELGVSIPKLDAMIHAARDAGAYGAKLSGGGGGDCMIALVPENKKEAVQKAITSVGGIIMDVSPQAEGVRVEQ